MVGNPNVLVKDKVYFYHMRKCGGTSIMQALRKYCHQHHLQTEYAEGSPFGTQKKFFAKYKPTEIVNAILFGTNDPYLKSFIWVTNLRNPVDRVYSLYLGSPDRTTMSVKEFILKFTHYKKPGIHWKVTSNYFIKALLNHQGDISRNELDKAIQLLSKMDCIFILDQKIRISKGLFLSLDIGHLRRKEPTLYDQIKDEMKVTRSLVEELNIWDFKLYQHFVKIARIQNSLN